MLIMLGIGIFGGFISGLVGIGGAIFIYPAILILPTMLGAPGYTPYVASGLTAVQVFFSTLSGTIKARKRSEFSPRLILYMGGGMFLGSGIGALLANMINGTFINIVYISIAILALILMFIQVEPKTSSSDFHTLAIAIMGAMIGVISGIVGAGGAFIIIPVLLAIFKLPMNIVVVNSIVIAFISSISSFAIKLFQGYVPLEEAVVLIIGSIIFAPIGLKVGQKIPSTIQKGIVIILIVIAIVQLVF